MESGGTKNPAIANGTSKFLGCCTHAAIYLILALGLL